MFKIGRLDFEPPDPGRFPCLRLAQQAWQAGGTASTLLNAANEVAVQAFLDRRIGFDAIPHIIETTLSRASIRSADSLEVILEDDAEARRCAAALIDGQSYRRVGL
jgi:1-deoxy-D-xylulose-5-phosphate reductoisomerase